MKFSFGDRVVLTKTNPGISGQIVAIYQSVSQYFQCIPPTSAENTRRQWGLMLGGLNEDQPMYCVLFDEPKYNLSKDGEERLRKDLREQASRYYDQHHEGEEWKGPEERENHIEQMVAQKLAQQKELQMVRCVVAVEDDLQLVDFDKLATELTMETFNE